MSTLRIAVVSVLSVCAVLASVRLWNVARSTAGMDFYQMWVGARAAREFDRFYEIDTRREMGRVFVERAHTEERSIRRIVVAQYRSELETLSTPLLYTIYSPLRGSYERDLLLFQIAVLGAFAGWVALLSYTYKYSLPGALLFYLALAILFAPVTSDLRVGNMNHIILLLLATAIWLLARGRLGSSAAVFMMATLIKPYTILVIPMLIAFSLARREWRRALRIVAGAAAAGVAGLVAAIMYFGETAVWLDWLREFQAMPAEMVPVTLGNFAFSRIVRDLSGGFDVSLIAMAVLGAIAVVMARRSAPGPHGDFLAAGLGCVVFQFGSPIVWLHHLLLSLPLLAYLLRPASAAELPRNVRRRQIAAAAAFLILAVEPWEAMLPTAMQVAATVNVGLLILYGAGLFDLSFGAWWPRTRSRVKS